MSTCRTGQSKPQEDDISLPPDKLEGQAGSTPQSSLERSQLFHINQLTKHELVKRVALFAGFWSPRALTKQGVRVHAMRQGRWGVRERITGPKRSSETGM